MNHTVKVPEPEPTVTVPQSLYERLIAAGRAEIDNPNNGNRAELNEVHARIEAARRGVPYKS